MARPSNTDRRQAEIVLGMRAVMAERGYERASVNLVAQAAGLSPGIVHYHFKNKQEILLRLVMHLGRLLRQRVESGLRRAPLDPQARLQAFVDAHLARDSESDPQAVACWVAIAAESIRQPEVAAALRSVLEEDLSTLTDLIRAALRASGRSTRQATALAAGVLSAIQGYLLLSASAPNLVPHGSAARTVNRMLAGAIDGGL